MHSEFDAVLFDFDGTLVPCLDLRDMKRRVVAFTLARCDLEREQAERMLAVELIEHAGQMIDARSGEGKTYRREAHGLIRDIEMAAARGTQPFAGVRDLLGSLRSRGIPSGVVTRNCADAVYAMFPDLDEYCTSVLTRDDVEFLKPDVRHLTQCLAALGAPAGQTAMVGDGALDMAAGRELGMLCIGVLGGHNDRRALEAAGAHRIVDSVAELAPAASRGSAA